MSVQNDSLCSIYIFCPFWVSFGFFLFLFWYVRPGPQQIPIPHPDDGIELPCLICQSETGIFSPFCAHSWGFVVFVWELLVIDTIKVVVTVVVIFVKHGPLTLQVASCPMCQLLFLLFNASQSDHFLRQCWNLKQIEQLFPLCQWIWSNGPNPIVYPKHRQIHDRVAG